MAQPARIRTPVLDVAYEASGPDDGLPVLLLHGFPYDVRSFDGVVALVNAAGFRTIVPWLRGYGGTQFLSADTLRSGEQAALGQDLLELLDALRIRKRCWPDMIGAAAPPAWFRRYGRSGWQAL